jgi:hypothetical protein
MDGIHRQDLAAGDIIRRIIENEVYDCTATITLHLGFVEYTCISWDQGWIPSIAYIIGAKLKVRN